MSNLASDSAVISLAGNAAHAGVNLRHAYPARIVWRQWSTMGVFFVLGFIHASWTANVPMVRDAFGLSPMKVSFGMLALAAGGIFTTIFLGSWLAKVGTGTAYKFAGSGMALSAALIMTMPTYWSMLLVLVVFGACAAMIDIAMNAEASHLEKSLDRPIMSKLHGMCSIGGVTGGVAGGAAIGMGLAPSVHMAGAAIFSLAILLVAQSFTTTPAVAEREAAPTSNESTSSRSLWILGGVAFVTLVAEGAMYNWSTIYMRDVVHTGSEFAGVGYVVFCGGLAAARFTGDRMRKRFGSAQLIRATALLACIGILVALLVPHPAFVVLGFAITGFGLANVVPVIFAAAARVNGKSTAQGLARVAGSGYIGILIGPVAIGGIAQYSGLTAGLFTVAICSAIVAVIAPPVLRKLLP